MKSVVELNRLLLKFLLSCRGVIQKSYCEDKAKFNFLGIIWERVKGPGRFIFQAFKESKIQNFLGSLQTSHFELFVGQNV